MNLPENWKDGDPVPKGLTVHDTPRERAAGQSPFAFRGDPMRNDRVVLRAHPIPDAGPANALDHTTAPPDQQEFMRPGGTDGADE